MRLTILLFILILSATARSQDSSSNSFILTGRVIGQDTGYVHIGYFNSKVKYVADSCYLRNGAFEFSGSIAEPTRVSFYGKRKSRSVDDPNWTELFIEPVKMQAVFKINEFKKAQITGSKTQDEFAIYMNRVDTLHNAWKNVFDKLDHAKKTNDTTEIEKINNNELVLYQKEYDNITFNFIKNFPASCISAYLLGYRVHTLTIDSLEMFYAALSPPVKQSLYGRNIGEFIAKAKKLETGMPAPDFSQADLTGKQVSLKAFRGNYILLDFWASWCVPCREENPFLKQAYNKYHNKGFTIISISLDKLEEKDAWIKAIAQMICHGRRPAILKDGQAKL